MPKSGAIIRPAKINVEVLPPVGTDSWTTETIHDHVEDIRRMFLRKLGQTSDDNVALKRVS